MVYIYIYINIYHKFKPNIGKYTIVPWIRHGLWQDTTGFIFRPVTFVNPTNVYRRSFGMWMLPSLKEAWFRVQTKGFCCFESVMLVWGSFSRSGPNPSWEFFTPKKMQDKVVTVFRMKPVLHIWRRKDWPAKGGSFGFLGDFPVRHANLRWFPELFVLKASPIHWETSIAWAASKKIKGGLLVFVAYRDSKTLLLQSKWVCPSDSSTVSEIFEASCFIWGQERQTVSPSFELPFEGLAFSLCLPVVSIQMKLLMDIAAGWWKWSEVRIEVKRWNLK